MDRNYKYMMADFRVLKGNKGWFLGRKALISNQNIYQIFEDEPWAHKLFYSGAILLVEVCGIPLKGKLVREQGSDGVCYHLLRSS